jgi:hypothetical protein
MRGHNTTRHDAAQRSPLQRGASTTAPVRPPAERAEAVARWLHVTRLATAQREPWRRCARAVAAMRASTLAHVTRSSPVALELAHGSGDSLEKARTRTAL